MKKLNLLALAVICSAATALAQTTPANPATAAQMKTLRTDIHATRTDKAAAVKDIKAGDTKDAKTEVKAVKADKANVKADAKTLKAEGVAKPVAKADAQIKIGDEKKLRTDIKTADADKKTLAADVKAGDKTDAKAEVKDLKLKELSISLHQKQDIAEGAGIHLVSHVERTTDQLWLTMKKIMTDEFE